MSYETALKIVDIVDGINKKYLLPAIQRELVWKPEQIEMLFDSLMRDYPIGSFLFWSVENKRVKDFKFYEFIREYHEKTNKHNAKANINGRQNITAILDGQQRLTSLFIGLKGSYSYKTYRMRADNPRAYTERKLYINLVREAKDNSGKKYNFQFLTEDEANIKDTDNYWFCVGEILNFKEYSDITNYLIANITYNDDYNYNKQQGLLSNRILSRLYEVVHVKGIISYYQEKSQELDKVLNIFIRINSGGTELSYSDLLLSIATAQWKEKDARAEIIKITDEINDIGDGFNFSKDFILKSCLVLNDFKNIAFKVDNFNNKNMAKIEKNWDSITSSIRQAVQLVSSFGYNKQTLKSNNAVIPIAYFLYNNELTDSFVSSTKNAKDRKNIKRWLDLSLIKRVFGGQSDNILKKIRKIIAKDETSSFPLEQITKSFKGTNRTLIFSDEEIESLLYSEYGKGFTFSVLSILYPSLDFRNYFHMDHIHPKSKFKKNILLKNEVPEQDISSFLENYNYLANLQFLEANPNLEKSDKFFEDWFNELPKEERNEYRKKHYIPKEDLCISNFLEFFEEREKLIEKKLKKLLQF